MSFGRPRGFENFKVLPPDRGSFPLDHDGDCKAFMLSYLKCLKANEGNNGLCRAESKAYLGCRMDNNLMERDDMVNLGLGDVGAQPHPSLSSLPASNSADTGATATASTKPETSSTTAPVDPNTQPRI